MNRKEEIQTIKKQIKIFDLIKQNGIKWWKAGFNKIKIRSLINYDKEPSCIVYINKNDFYDFSANIGGSVIDFYMILTKKDYVEAIKDLRNMLEGKLKLNDIKLNDYTECRNEFENLMSLILSVKNKTKHLKKLLIVLREVREEIAKEELLEINNSIDYSVINKNKSLLVSRINKPIKVSRINKKTIKKGDNL